ncbi:MAG: SRPBCC family protein [Deltaproteobacteria bacterium]|nr:SRPBCC family protein [Deltaproteobacteria bacterium]
MAKVIRSKELAVSVERLVAVILDFESYPEFLSGVVSARREQSSNGKPVVTFELEIIKRFEYTLEFNITGVEEIAWKLVKSNFFKKNDGRWLLKRMGQNRTHASYELDLAFGFLVPGWVAKTLTEVNLPKMFDQFEARALEVRE